MNQLLQVGHPLLAGAALLFTLILSLRLLRRSKERITPAETVLAQAARVAMLLLYLSGLILSYNLKRPVAFVHHIASLLPVLVLLIFQFLPSLRKAELSIRWHGWMFVGLLVAYLIISAAAFWPIG